MKAWLNWEIGSGIHRANAGIVIVCIANNNVVIEFQANQRPELHYVYESIEYHTAGNW